MPSAPHQMPTRLLVLLSSDVFSTIPVANRTAGTVIWCIQHHISCWQDCWYYCHLVSSAPYQLLTGLLVLLSSGVFSITLVADRTAGAVFWCLQHHTSCWQDCWYYCHLVSSAPYQLLTGLLVLLSSDVFSTILVADRTVGTTLIWCLQHHTSCWQDCWYYCHLVSSAPYHTSCWQDCWYYCHLVSLAPYELPTGLLVLMSTYIFQCCFISCANFMY